MNTAAAAMNPAPAAEFLAAFAAHNDLLGGGAAYRRQRLAAAGACLDDHPDLDGWMPAPGTAGTWLKVPLGKLHNERSVPLDDTALEALDEWLLTEPLTGLYLTPGTGTSPTSCSSNRAGASTPAGFSGAYATR